MENTDLSLEKMWIQQRIKSVELSKMWMIRAIDVMGKYNFDDHYPMIISLLRRSNDSLWEQVDEGTLEARKYNRPDDLPKELNYNYTDIDLIEFFEKHAGDIQSLIKSIPDDERSLDDNFLFEYYFANLFAHKINGCEIHIENNEIRIQQTTIDYES